MQPPGKWQIDMLDSLGEKRLVQISRFGSSNLEEWVGEVDYNSSKPKRVACTTASVRL
jgi:hypothetical protein